MNTDLDNDDDLDSEREVRMVHFEGFVLAKRDEHGDDDVALLSSDCHEAVCSDHHSHDDGNHSQRKVCDGDADHVDVVDLHEH